MNFYQLDYVVDKVLKDTPSREQAILKRFANKDFAKKEAAYVWERITDHKWYLGERLKRDVGFYVATIDFLENFYEPNTFFEDKSQQSRGFRRRMNFSGSNLRNYFVSKSKIFQL